MASSRTSTRTSTSSSGRTLPDALSGGASYFPAQIAAGVRAPPRSTTSNIKGSGEAIAIVIDTFPAATDLEAFWKAAGINQSIANIQFIQAVAGHLARRPSGEETLDTEWSSSIAPGARVRVYAATDLRIPTWTQAYQQVYDDVTKHPYLGIHQMSMSYGAGRDLSRPTARSRPMTSSSPSWPPRG